MPLFETSSLFILLLAYQKYSGDTTYTQQYRPLLEGYADYLVYNSLYPSSQLTSVDAIPATANQTGLAVQSVIGLKAASVILKNDTLAETADSFAKSIYDDGLGLDGEDPARSSHFTYNYGKSSTWNVLFPAYSDVLLELKGFPSEAWELQSKWYESQLRELGLPFAGPSDNLDYIGTPLIWALLDWSKLDLRKDMCGFNVADLLLQTSSLPALLLPQSRRLSSTRPMLTSPTDCTMCLSGLNTMLKDLKLGSGSATGRGVQLDRTSLCWRSKMGIGAKCIEHMARYVLSPDAEITI